jgi:hypothetical protein
MVAISPLTKAYYTAKNENRDRKWTIQQPKQEASLLDIALHAAIWRRQDFLGAIGLHQTVPR